MGVPMRLSELKEPVALNDIRRWVQAMHYPNPLHYDESDGRPRAGGPRSWRPCRSPSPATPATAPPRPRSARSPGSHLIFGGDDWWFFGPRARPGDKLVCHRMPYDYKVADTKFAGPTCFQRGDTLYINQKGERVALQRSTAIRYGVQGAKDKDMFGSDAGGSDGPDSSDPSATATARRATASRSGPTSSWPSWKSASWPSSTRSRRSATTAPVLVGGRRARRWPRTCSGPTASPPSPPSGGRTP